MTSHPIDEIIRQRRIIITCGTGGVGKTTLSAAIAIRAALLGKRTCVITIDPAKRLATSLGLEGQLGDHPLDLTAQLAKAYGKPLSGTLDAIMPDTRQTFEQFFRSLTHDQALAERVIRNPIFEIFAKEFSGTNEYMALQKLYALERSGRYDCIILDTPPSRNTLDFLNAPKLLAQFFEERLIRWLVLPANKLVAMGMKKALGVLESLTGAHFMRNLVDFAAALYDVQDGFTANLRRLMALLESPELGFLMVAAPAPDLAPETDHFIEKLKEHRFRFEGVALNRTLSYLKASPDAMPGSAGLDAAREVVLAIQARERQSIADLVRKGTPIRARLPELSRDIHSLEDLLHVAMAFDPRAGD